ncbi:hypothetical protein BH23ACT11_BH23ACT11_10670 [soil metagenome]
MVEAVSGTGEWLDSHSIFVQYLIVRNDNNRLNLLSLHTDCGESLPVFSSEIAAHAYLGSNGYREEGWHVRESTAGELISLLMGHIADVELVTVDPPSDGLEGEGITLEVVDKRDYIGSLMQEPILLSHT